VPAVQRDILHGILINHLADRHGRGFDDGRLGGDLHGFGYLADLQRVVL